jgi:membrane-bound ClpP family serine protease
VDFMSIGTGIVLFVIGAILTFAVHIQNAFISIQLIGEILMGAGVVVFVIGLIFMFRKRQSITTVSNGVDANGANVSQRHTSVTPDDTV